MTKLRALTEFVHVMLDLFQTLPEDQRSEDAVPRPVSHTSEPDVPRPLAIIKNPHYSQETTPEKTTPNKEECFFLPDDRPQWPRITQWPRISDKESKNSKQNETRNDSQPPCEAIGCYTKHTGRIHVQGPPHEYFVEIFYTCPVIGCNSRYQAKHRLADHYRRSHIPDSRYEMGTTRLHENNQIYGYYADAPLNTELIFCPLCPQQGRTTNLKGRPLLTHFETEHGYVQCGINKGKCSVFTNFKAGYMQHVRLDHSIKVKRDAESLSSLRRKFSCQVTNCEEQFLSQVALNLHSHNHAVKFKTKTEKSDKKIKSDF